MEEKAEKVMKDQRKALSHFLQIISTSTSADNIANAFKLFLMYDGKVQKFMNQIIEHQRITKEIQDLNKELNIVNKDIKKYVNKLNKVDCNLENLMTESSIYKSNDYEDIVKKEEKDEEKGNDGMIFKIEKKQHFSLDDLIKCGYSLREGTGVKQINLMENEAIKQQIPHKYPVPQPSTQNKSILHLSVDNLKKDFLNKIKDSLDDENEDESDSDDEDIEDSDNSDDHDLGDFF